MERIGADKQDWKKQRNNIYLGKPVQRQSKNTVCLSVTITKR